MDEFEQRRQDYYEEQERHRLEGCRAGALILLAVFVVEVVLGFWFWLK